jgi:hypothetical protein
MNATTIPAATPDVDALLAEQRHQFLDLDADSTCPIPGASCPACPPRDEEATS